MALDDRGTSVGGAVKRTTKEGTRRRVTKSDGRLADYSSLRTATGIVIPEVRKVLLDRQKEHKEDKARRTHIMYPSEMCKNDWCPRGTYWRMQGVEDSQSKPSLTMESIFAEGHAIHEKWQNWLSDSGKMWGDWRCTRCGEYVKNSLYPTGDSFGSCVGIEHVDLTVPGGPYMGDIGGFAHNWKYKEVTLKNEFPPISGHADGALVEHNALIEIKSMSLGGLRYEAPKLIEANTFPVNGRKITDIERVWKDFHHPLSAHLRQGNLYLWMCQQMGMPFDKLAFIYEFKSNQQAKEFVVPYSFSLIEPAVAQAYNIMEHLGAGIPPNCIKGKDGCSQCRIYEKKED